MGSLVTALASWLDARSAGGAWHVRIEDIDPPREVEGADRLILQSLQAHGLIWDGEVSWQSQRRQRHLDLLQQLLQQGDAYFCTCSRSDISAMGGVYDGRCRRNPPLDQIDAAIRFHVTQPATWQDGIMGYSHYDPAAVGGDFVVLRRDGLIGYQWAVAIDDTDQGITDVVRGADLYDSTARQLMILQTLGLQAPRYAHLPLVLDAASGQKLSKQNLAPALDAKKPLANLRQAANFLGLCGTIGDLNESIADFLSAAVARWHLDRVPRGNRILATP